MTLVTIKPYLQAAVVLVVLGLGVLCGRACAPAPKPIIAVSSDTVVGVSPTVAFKDHPEVVEKVHLRTQGKPANKKTLAQIVDALTTTGAVANVDTVSTGDLSAPVPTKSHPNIKIRVSFNGEKVFAQKGNTIQYGWRGDGSCEFQMADNAPWLELGSSPIDLTASSAVAITPLATPEIAQPRNRLTLAAGYGTNGWVASGGVSRSLVWKHKFTKAVMPDELGGQALLHASGDVDVLVTGSWRF